MGNLSTKQGCFNHCWYVPEILSICKSVFFLGEGAHAVPFPSLVGPPLPVELVENPTEEQVNQLHQKYLNHVMALYEEHKDQFFKDRVRDLAFAK
jgi:hypothetical protein